MTLSPAPGLEEECRALEQRLDDVAGVHARRYYYSEALVEHPESVRPILSHGLAAGDRKLLEDNFGVVRQLMMARMDLGAEQQQESRLLCETELDCPPDPEEILQACCEPAYGPMSLCSYRAVCT